MSPPVTLGVMHKYHCLLNSFNMHKLNYKHFIFVCIFTVFLVQNGIIGGDELTKCIDLFLHYVTVVFTLRVLIKHVDYLIASFKLSSIVLPYSVAK